MAKDEMQRVLTKVANLTTVRGHSMGLVLISHAVEVEDEGKMVWMPSLSKAPRLVITGMSDLICFADLRQDSNGDIERTLRVGPHPKFITGGRMHGLPPVVNLEYVDLEQAMMVAMKGESK
jgi:hypothetical protein